MFLSIRAVTNENQFANSKTAGLSNRKWMFPCELFSNCWANESGLYGVRSFDILFELFAKLKVFHCSLYLPPQNISL